MDYSIKSSSNQISLDQTQTKAQQRILSRENIIGNTIRQRRSTQLATSLGDLSFFNFVVTGTFPMPGAVDTTSSFCSKREKKTDQSLITSFPFTMLISSNLNVPMTYFYRPSVTRSLLIVALNNRKIQTILYFLNAQIFLHV